MSVLLKKIVWYRVDDPDVPIVITDALDMNIARGLDIKNNVVILNLVNPSVSLDASANVTHRYVDEEFEIMFEEQDQIRIYLKYTDDMSDVESSEWSDDPNSLPSEDYLKGVYYVIEFGVSQDIKGNPIKVKCADKCYVLFSRLHVAAYTASQALDAPHAIQKVVRSNTHNQKGEYVGDGDDAGSIYDIDARFDDVESGFIQKLRKNTTEKGGVADTSFPTIALAKVWKPVYEWITELSQIEYLNTNDELVDNDKIVYSRPFLYYVDELNRFHWFETTDEVAEGNTIVIGETEEIYSYKLVKKVFDTVNFIIFRTGKDLYSKGTLYYHVEDTSNVKNKRMRVIAMTDITTTLIENEKKKGNLVENAAGTFTIEGVKYNRNGTVTPHWTTDTYNTDSGYNDALKEKAKADGLARARSITMGLAHARYKGSMERKGSIVTVGSLLDITNKATGQASELIRVMDVRDTINKTGWFTNLTLEQDQEAIVEGATRT